MREMLSLLLVCMAALSANCQTFPRLEWSTTTYHNNSFIDRGVIGQDATALRCVTNRAGCCTDPSEGDWTDPEGGDVFEGVTGASTVYVTRETAEVRLNRITGGDIGMWRCDIPDSSGDLQMLYIYLGDSSSGELASATVSFTALHSEPNVDPPEFSLTCLSVGGPATTVSWQRASQPVQEDSDHETSQILTVTTQATQYENRLTVTGREAGQYRCTVSSNRDDFFGATGSTITSDTFTVLVAGEPARVHAVRQSPTSILVAWDSPGGDVTGYNIYYQRSGGSEVTAEVSGGATESYLLEGLDNGVEYSISVVALSPHLPSAVVGPITPTTLTHPTVSITDNLASAVVGSSYTLTCQVTIPGGVTITGIPHVEFEGPGLSATGAVIGSGSDFSSTEIVSLSLSSRGDYTCSAQYFVDEDVSPKGIDTLTADVMIGTPSITVEVRGDEVTYIGNDVTVECVVILNGVRDGNDVDVSVSWMKDGTPFTGVTDRVTINSPETQLSGVAVSSTVDFSPLESSDTAMYTCEVVITPREGNVPALTASETMTLDVITPTVSVETSPSSLRILDVAPHNQLSVTCTASASAGAVILPLEVSWQRQAGSDPFQPLPSSSYMYVTSGDADSGYDSVLTGSEMAASTVQLRCTATITVNGNIEASSTTTLTVSGPMSPLQPDNVRSSDVQDSRATVQWTVTSISYTPETYVVMYGTAEGNLDTTSVEKREDDITARDRSFSVQLSGLQPATVYYYRVRATNSQGDTDSDGVKTFETRTRRTDPPSNIAAVMAGNALTYSFSWGPPANLYNSFVLDYTVTCSPSLDGARNAFNATMNNMTLTATVALDYGLTYNCCVVARNNGGPSDPTCLADTITTPGQKPTGPPQNFQISPTARNLTFSWVPPSPDSRNGLITGYTIQCSDYPETLTPPGGSSFTASGFTPNTSYNCSIFASNADGDGPATYRLVNTLEAAPDAAPRDFSHSVIDGVSDVTFQWSSPPEGTANGVITHYTVTCNSSTEDTPGQELSLVVTSLSPGTWYSCSVSASTSAGEGPQSDSMAVLTVPGAPGSLTLTEMSSEPVGLLAEWNKVAGVVTGYKVEVSLMGRGGNRTFSSSNTSFTVTSEEVGGYEPVSVQVAAVNIVGSGPPSSPETGITPPIPPGVVGEVSTDPMEADTVTISWQRPDFPNGILTGYTVFVQLYQDSSVITGRTTDNVTLSVTIQNASLEAGVPYYVVVVATNEKGSGMEEKLLFYTAELKPGVVEVETLPTRSSSGDSLTLSWQQPDPVLARGTITGYRVDFTEAVVGEAGRRRRQAGDCQNGTCAVVAGESQGCCEVPADETSVTIVGLDPDKAYNVSVSAINGAGTGLTQTFTVEGAESDGGSSEFPIVIVIAVVVVVVVIAVLLVLITIITVVMVKRNRKMQSYQAYPSESSPSPRYVEQDVKPVSPSKVGGGEMKTYAAANPKRSPEEMERMKPVEMSQFSEHVRHMHQDRDKGFEIEYQSLSSDPLASSDKAKEPANKTKNRFANIFPYDHNRVPLREIEGVEGSDYINASFIDGYSHEKAYIAAQGPMSGTISDFWRVLWEHRLKTIVMLTKQVEAGKRKCEVYWPDKVGETFNAGAGIQVQYRQLMPFADYEIRIFIVTHAGQPNLPQLEVTHFQFLSWPDHGVPQYATALIGFIRRVRQHHKHQETMLVHCSAGVGRTGAFILLDSMLERIMSESTVNVYAFLTHMRTQRVHLVQTLAQYVFIHDALEELITCGDTSISSSNLRVKIGKMHKILPDKAISGFSDQFKLLQKVSRHPEESELSDALETYNREKNRYLSRVPYSKNHIRLRPTGVTGAEYINASYLDGYKHRNAYIVTQAPVPSTVNDFWKMMWEFKSRAIVMLCQLSENGEEMSYGYWPTQQGARQLCGKYSVTLISEEELHDTPEVMVRKFEIADDKNTTSFSITQYHLSGWAEQGRVSPQILLRLIEQLRRTQQNTGNKPITVMCNDGMGRSGAFVCIHAMLERMKTEGMVDFFQFIKSSRICRPNIVTQQEHYILCHDTVADYLDSFDTYANFKA